MLEETVGAIRKRCARRPAVGLILGSGLGALADTLHDGTVIPFRELPHFPQPGVEGHAGNLIIGELEGAALAVLQGRVHLYEGWSPAQAAYPTRVLARLGVHTLVVTGAAGSLRAEFGPGDLMLIDDHINLLGANPLAGAGGGELAERFTDMSEAYDRPLRDLALRAAADLGIPLRQGVYIALLGPSYETPAEVRMCRILGADAVGMSVVPEVIAARQLGVRVLGLACISNMAAGMLPQPIRHREVIVAAARACASLGALLRALLPRLAALGREGGGARA